MLEALFEAFPAGKQGFRYLALYHDVAEAHRGSNFLIGATMNAVQQENVAVRSGRRRMVSSM